MSLTFTPTVSLSVVTVSVAPSAWCFTATSRGSRAAAPGMWARSGSTRRGSASICPLVRRSWKRLAAEGRRDLVTLGVTPVLAAQLDDPYCPERGLHRWLGLWRTRRRALLRGNPPPRAVASESSAGPRRRGGSEPRWRHGALPAAAPARRRRRRGAARRPGDPPVPPALAARVADVALGRGWTTALALRPARPGIWAPECGCSPAWSGVTPVRRRHFLVDEATMGAAGATSAAGPSVRARTSRCSAGTWGSPTGSGARVAATPPGGSTGTSTRGDHEQRRSRPCSG